MKFSVIIPLYNKAPYIRKALESVLAQTYTDYELIIVDDGSTDGSAEIAEAFLHEAIRLQGYEAKGMENSVADTLASRLSPLTSNLTSDSVPASRLSPLAFRLLKQKNAGVSAARNNGFSVSSAEYLAFLDADDWWEPTYLERMAQLITDYPDAGLYACNYYYHKDGTNIIKVDIPTGYFNYPKEYFNNFAMPVWTGATMIPRKVFDEMGGFPLGVKLGEDFLLWAKIALHDQVAFLNEPLAYYNNTLPPNHRATLNLHKPEENMLFRLELVFSDVTSDADWQRLIDMLRLLGLHNYWLCNEYHNIAQRELDKVDMSQQYDFLVKLYRLPRWIQKMKQRIVRIAAPIKHKLKQIRSKKTDNANPIINNKQYRESLFGNKSL